jgi:hypothetical protein
VIGVGPFRRFVVEGYPLLRARADALRVAGVRFFDTTALFENESKEIYRDNCCHLNGYGDRLLANEVARQIREDLAKTPCFSKLAIATGAGPQPPRTSSRRCRAH